MSQRIALTLLTSGGWTSLVVAAQECSTAGRRCQHHSQEEPASWPKPDPHQHNNLTIPAECQWAIDTLFSRQRADPTRRGDAASVTDTVWSIFKENLAGRLPSGVATPKIVDIGPRGLAMYHVYLSRFYRGSSTHYLSRGSYRQWMRQGAAGLARVPPELCWLPHRRGEVQFLHIARVRYYYLRCSVLLVRCQVSVVCLSSRKFCGQKEPTHASSEAPPASRPSGPRLRCGEDR